VSGKIKHFDEEHVARAVDHARKLLLAYGEDGGLSDDTEPYQRSWRLGNMRALTPTDFYGEIILPLKWNEPLMQELAARAKKDAEAVCVLRSVAANLLRQGVPLPASLAAWVADYLTKGSPVRSSRRGPHSRANVQRNDGLARAVKTMTRPPWGFAPTRNRQGGSESACSIVARAATSLGVNVTERAIEKVWTHYRDRI
jgi:hypothetical protein